MKKEKRRYQISVNEKENNNILLTRRINKINYAPAWAYISPSPYPGWCIKGGKERISNQKAE